MQKKLLSCNEAIAQGAYEAGVKFASSYPGTPATEILEYLTQFNEVYTQWSVNEKVAFEVALGASFAGVRSIYSSKQVGLNVAMDPLMTSAYSGINGGLVIVVGDDPGMHSSQNEQDTRLVSKYAKIPLLEPSSPSEAKELIKKAFDISEQFDTPVLFRITTRLAHSKEVVEINNRIEVQDKFFDKNNVSKYVMIPTNAYKKRVLLEDHLLKLQQFSNDFNNNTIEFNDLELGIITSGISYLYVKEKYPQASVLKLAMSFPFPDDKIKYFCSRVKNIYVVEENEPFIEEHILELGIKCTRKHYTYRVGELNQNSIVDIIEGNSKIFHESVDKFPILCPGCPHRAVFVALRDTKVIVSGDIGCYTLGVTPPLSSIHTIVCMGTGITFFESFSRILGSNKAVAVVGDSTFVHSGITGLINCAYNNVNGLIIILDNGTTAMTGIQPNPTTGVTAKGEKTKKLNLEQLCKICGADNVEVVDSSTISIKEKVEKYINKKELSILIIRTSLCKMIDKTKQSIPMFQKDKCVKCFKCVSVACPAIFKNNETMIQIDKNLCTGCNVCVEQCKFNALK